MEIVTKQQLGLKTWPGAVRLIPSYLVWRAYLGNTEAKKEIKEIEEFNRKLSNK